MPFSLHRFHFDDGRVHHMSGHHWEMQLSVVRHAMFTQCLMLFHKRLVRIVQPVLGESSIITIVVSCNAGCQRSVAMVNILRALLCKDGWPSVVSRDLHLHGCADPRVPDNCCQCAECRSSHGVSPVVLASAYQQWRAVCS